MTFHPGQEESERDKQNAQRQLPREKYFMSREIKRRLHIRKAQNDEVQNIHHGDPTNQDHSG
jgi:hypothetical protein